MPIRYILVRYESFVKDKYITISKLYYNVLY